MDLSNAAKSIFRTVAPAAASFFGTPLAGLAVKSVLDRWMGGQEGKPLDAKAVERALSQLTPEQAVALQKADQEFSVQMEQLGLKAEELKLEAERIAGADRDSARAREIALKDWTPKVLAVLIISTYAGVTAYLLTHVIVPDMESLVMRTLGVLDAALGLCLAYFFGSSSGSKEKTDTMARLASGRRRLP